MDVAALQRWLAEPRTALVAAVAEGVRAHVASLKSRNIGFYGYALLPGEPYDIHSLVAVTNSEADIKVPRSNEQYRYYKFSVDEWAHWDHDRFPAANALLAQANEQFASMHTNDEDDFSMDKFEIAHSDALLDAVVRGLALAKAESTFGDAAPFLAVWISDSGHAIMAESVQRLNSGEMAKEFLAEFG